MAKTKVQEWDATASNNTDIDSTNIDENCSPAGLNNAIRSMMSHVKAALTGSDDGIVTGTAGTASNLAMWNTDGDLVDAVSAVLPNAMTFNDNIQTYWGTGQDVGIRFNGTATWQFLGGTNAMQMRTDGSFFVMSADTTETMISASRGGAVSLFHNNATKAATTADGLTVTGDVTVDADAYGAGWSGSQEVPTKGDIYTKVETLATVQYYKSTTPTTGSAGGTITEAHGLGGVPDQAWAKGVCIANDQTYEVGDVVWFYTHNNDGTGVVVSGDATNVNLIISSLGISMIEEDGTGEDVLTPSRWDFTLYASVIS